MLNLSELASAASLEAAIENSTKVSTSKHIKNALSNKTVFNSTIKYETKEVANDTAYLDFSLCLLSSLAASFHQSQVIELLKLEDCNRTTIAKHVHDKRTIYSDYLTVDMTSKVFTVVNQEFFQSVVSMSEFKQQLQKHATKLFELIDSNNTDYEIAHLENYHLQAIAMNAAFSEAKTKKLKIAAIA
jgi:hypothetical protein